MLSQALRVVCTTLAISSITVLAAPAFLNTGCGKPHAAGYQYKDSNGNYSIVSGGVERYYAVQVPDFYNPLVPYRLIFDYHGNSDTETEQRNNSQYFNYPAHEAYVIVYPQGYERHWEGPLYAVPGINDLQFTTDLLAHIQGEYCIDPISVYASGKSNGAGFVDTLACSDNGDAFAAFAMASAALYTDNNRTDCTKKRAILESHGDADTVVPYVGKLNGKGGNEPDIAEWVHWWGERDCGNNAQGVTTGDLGGYNITTYSCYGMKDVVNHYHFAKLGHCWPDAQGDNYDALNQVGQNCAEVRVVDYTSVVLDFFSKWDLINSPK